MPFYIKMYSKNFWNQSEVVIMSDPNIYVRRRKLFNHNAFAADTDRNAYMVSRLLIVVQDQAVGGSVNFLVLQPNQAQHYGAVSNSIPLAHRVLTEKAVLCQGVEQAVGDGRAEVDQMRNLCQGVFPLVLEQLQDGQGASCSLQIAAVSFPFHGDSSFPIGGRPPLGLHHYSMGCCA